MKYLFFSIITLALVSCSSSKTNGDALEVPTSQTDAQAGIQAVKNFHFFSVPSLDETSTLTMGDYKGKKILVVNVASKCGYTPQYEGLQQLHEQYGEQVQIIGFPCNQFMGQEPGGKEEIAAFCQKNYGVTFPLSTKLDVKGKDQHPIYSWLTHKEENGVGDFKVSWNFNKFLIDEEGKLIAHYPSGVEPMSEELIAAIKK